MARLSRITAAAHVPCPHHLRFRLKPLYVIHAVAAPRRIRRRGRVAQGWAPLLPTMPRSLERDRPELSSPPAGTFCQVMLVDLFWQLAHADEDVRSEDQVNRDELGQTSKERLAVWTGRPRCGSGKPFSDGRRCSSGKPRSEGRRRRSCIIRRVFRTISNVRGYCPCLAPSAVKYHGCSGSGHCSAYP